MLPSTTQIRSHDTEIKIGCKVLMIQAISKIGVSVCVCVAEMATCYYRFPLNVDRTFRLADLVE